MSNLPYLPFYVGEYLRETRHLTLEQHGAYVLLLLEYWWKSSLPDDDLQLARIVGVTPAKWQKLKPVLLDLFDDGWRHERIDEQIKKSQDKVKKAKESAEARWRKAA
jgi:uncharacterized protein YdaU (DUF1376 family)